MRFSRVLACLLGASTLACATARPSRPSPPPQPLEAAAPPPAPDLSPIPAPPGLSAVVSVKDAALFQRSVRDLAGGAFPVLQRITAGAAAQAFLGTALADVVDLGKPIDLAIVDGARGYAASFSIVSIDDAKRNLAEDFDLVPRDGGAIELAARKGDDSTTLRCELRPSAGDAPYRLICANRAAPLRVLAPYLARTVAREAAPRSARIRAFSDLFSRAEITPSDASPDMEPLIEWTRTAFADIGTLTIDLALDDSGVDVEAKGVFPRTASPFTRVALAHAQETKALPDLFWRLPADSLGAVYARGADAVDLKPMKTWMLHVWAKGWRSSGSGEEIADRLTNVVRETLLTGGPVAAAYGFDVPGAVSAIEGATVKHPLERSALHGWFIVGLDEPSSRWKGAIRELIAIEHLPWKPEGMLKKRDEATVSRFEELPLADAKLPAGTAHFAVREYALSKGKAKPPAKWTFHVYVVPDGTHTWLALGENDRVVVAKAKETLSAGKDGGLASRTPLRALSGSMGLAGFVTKELFDALRGPNDPADPTRARALLERLSVSSEGTATPIVFSLRGAPREGDAVDLRIFGPTEAVKAALSR